MLSSKYRMRKRAICATFMLLALITVASSQTAWAKSGED